MKITIESSGELSGGIDYEVCVENSTHKTSHSIQYSPVGIFDKFATDLEKFPFESRNNVTMTIDDGLMKHSQFTYGIYFEVYLLNALGEIGFKVQTINKRAGEDVTFVSRVDTASLQRLSRGLKAADFSRRNKLTWDSEVTD